MLSRRNILCTLALLIGLTMLSGTVEAGPISGDIKLLAVMRAGVTKAKAKYEEIKNDTRRKFSFEVERGAPGQTAVVSVNGISMGSATVNNLGRAKFELDTRLGHSVPQFTSGASVVVKVNGIVVMTGALR